MHFPSVVRFFNINFEKLTNSVEHSTKTAILWCQDVLISESIDLAFINKPSRAQQGDHKTKTSAALHQCFDHRQHMQCFNTTSPSLHTRYLSGLSLTACYNYEYHYDYAYDYNYDHEHQYDDAYDYECTITTTSSNSISRSPDLPPMLHLLSHFIESD